MIRCHDLHFPSPAPSLLAASVLLAAQGLLAGAALLASAQAGAQSGAPPAAQAPVGPAAMVDAFEGASGKHPGFRRSGAKGVCASGEFVGDAEGRALSTASAFSGRPVPVIARFSVGGGNPKASDKGKSTRGLALQLDLPDGEVWQMANISAPVFAASTPQMLAGLLEARRLDPATGKLDAARAKAFEEAHPDVTAQMRWLAAAPVPASYGSVNYWGVNAFGFVDAKGEKRLGKWVFEPVKGTRGLTDEELRALPDEFLIDELRRRVAAEPLEFVMRLQLAAPGDRTDSATVPLPAERPSVTLGRLTLRQVEPGAGGACDPITFNPLALPKGIEPSADPILLARPAPYAVSLGRRLSESPAR